MTQTSPTVVPPPTTPDVAAPDEGPGARRAGAGGALLVLLGLSAALVLAAGWHLTQGTSGVGFGDLLDWMLGREQSHGATASTGEILAGSRIPRLAAGMAVGFALGVAGALLQSLARNAMASPDTLAVTGGAYFAVTLVAALGLSLPLWASGLTAFVGGLVAAVVVLAISGGAGTSTTRLILAGSA